MGLVKFKLSWDAECSSCGRKLYAGDIVALDPKHKGRTGKYWFQCLYHNPKIVSSSRLIGRPSLKDLKEAGFKTMRNKINGYKCKQCGRVLLLNDYILWRTGEAYCRSHENDIEEILQQQRLKPLLKKTIEDSF